MFDTDHINFIEFRLLEGQVDLLLEALQLYAFNFHRVWAIDRDSDLEELRNSILFYTYEQISSKLNNSKHEFYDVMGECRLIRKRKKQYIFNKSKKNIA